MPRVCTICTHPEREAIDQALAAGQPLRGLSAIYRVSEDALGRHKANHLPLTLAKATEAAEAARADDLLAQVMDLQERTLQALEKAEKTGRLPVVLKAVREARENLKLLAQLTGELQEQQTTVNVLVASPEWLRTRRLLMEALEPYPEARAAVARALLEVDRGAG